MITEVTTRTVTATASSRSVAARMREPNRTALQSIYGPTLRDESTRLRPQRQHEPFIAPATGITRPKPTNPSRHVATCPKSVMNGQGRPRRRNRTPSITAAARPRKVRPLFHSRCVPQQASRNRRGQVETAVHLKQDIVGNQRRIGSALRTVGRVGHSDSNRCHEPPGHHWSVHGPGVQFPTEFVDCRIHREVLGQAGVVHRVRAASLLERANRWVHLASSILCV